MKNEKPISDPGYSPMSLLIMSCSIAICTAVLVFALFYIRQHPVLFSLLSLFSVRTILDAKIERVVVLNDRIEVITRGVLPWMTKRRVVVF